MTVKSCIFIYVTCPTHKDAQELVYGLLQERLIACGNILSPITSCYIWEGQVQTSEEYGIFLKTMAQNYEKIEHFIIQNHPYACPCVISLPIEKGFMPFLNWIESNTV